LYSDAPQPYESESLMTIWEKLRLLQEWSPVLSIAQEYLAEKDAHKKAIIVADAAEWLTSKTTTKIDDRIVSRLAAVLKTPQGEDLLREIVAIAGELGQPEVPK